jgi:hypothetical protein
MMTACSDIKTYAVQQKCQRGGNLQKDMQLLRKSMQKADEIRLLRL